MTTYRLQRLADVDLVFEGELLADESTYERGIQRWQEVRIYRTDSDRWVVERTGKSIVPNEVDRPNVTVCDTPADVRAAMTFQHKHKGQDRSYVTDVCYGAMQSAAEKDHRLDEALVVRV
jgi:hypothetical protein